MPGALRQLSQRVVEAHRELSGAHGPQARRGELDGQRDPVERPDDLGERRGVARQRHRARSGCLGTIGQQLDRSAGRSLDRVVRRRDCQRPEVDDALTIDPETLATGRQHDHPR